MYYIKKTFESLEIRPRSPRIRKYCCPVVYIKKTSESLEIRLSSSKIHMYFDPLVYYINKPSNPLRSGSVLQGFICIFLLWCVIFKNLRIPGDQAPFSRDSQGFVLWCIIFKNFPIPRDQAPFSTDSRVFFLLWCIILKTPSNPWRTGPVLQGFARFFLCAVKGFSLRWCTGLEH